MLSIRMPVCVDDGSSQAAIAPSRNDPLALSKIMRRHWVLFRRTTTTPVRRLASSRTSEGGGGGDCNIHGAAVNPAPTTAARQMAASATTAT